MKKSKTKVLLTLLCLVFGISCVGCGSEPVEEEETYLTPDDIENVYYLSEEELPDDMVYIVRTSTEQVTDKDGNVEEVEVTKYYPIYYAVETNCGNQPEGNAGVTPDRIMWVNYNIDEGYIPTMYPGDKLIYKSHTFIPTKYSLEKFYDNGYTLGVALLGQDLSGNYRYDPEDYESFVMTTSDAVGFESLEGVESIYLVAVGENRVTPINVSTSGTITGLNLMEKYACDIRTGTERIDATLTCNIHEFSSAETYWFGSFSFISPHIAELNVPDYVTTGYYNINNLGIFRYIKEEGVDYHDLSFEDYNETIFEYNENDRVIGTKLGLTFDEHYFLIATGYSDGDEENGIAASITTQTSIVPDKNGLYTGTYVFESMSDPVTSGNIYNYVIRAKNVDNGEILNFKYTRYPGEEIAEVGKTYIIMFEKPTDSFDGYVISYMTEVNGEKTVTTEDTEPEQATESESETETEQTTE